MKRVLVTGADGYIGRHLIKRLLDGGAEIWAVVYPESPMRNMYLETECVHTICTEFCNLTQHIQEFPVDADAFYHFAWQGVNAENRNDLTLQLENIPLTLDCIRLAGALRVKKFIIPGSTSEYLEYGSPINERAVPTPQNAYGSVKVALRYLAAACSEEVDIGLIYTVITGIYSADRRDNNVIFYTIDKLLRGEKPSLTSLEQKWDYVYIDDAVDALYLIGEKGIAGKFYAIGHGDNQPLSHYIYQVRDCINPDLPLGLGEIPYKNDRLPSSCIDLSALRSDTGFIPHVDFSDGIRRVISVMKKDREYEKD